ncbi:coiled-coil domain-containing protein 187 [Microtus oregoni]|uniref:coiled-coil domain-containing protein 187 n=1 Tax=Microtus oregoni TaxID=111838 RepID=UPI001BB1197D|nr:coiled-coil domain-containing protein 187 [Microtus oregoni]
MSLLSISGEPLVWMCLGLKGREAARATLWEKQQQALSRLEKERREIQYLKKVYASLHRDRKQLLQHQQSILDVQRSVAHLRQELQARTQRLQEDNGLISEAPATGQPSGEGAPDYLTLEFSMPLGNSGQESKLYLLSVPISRCLGLSSSSSVKVAWEGVSDTHQKTEEHRPGSPQSHNPQELSDSLKVSDLSPEQKEVAPPQTTSATDKLLQPQRLKWAGVTPGTGSPSVESGHDSQGPGKQPCVSPPGLLHSSSLDSEHHKHSAFPVEKDGNPVSQLKPQETEELLLPGNAPGNCLWAIPVWIFPGASSTSSGPCPSLVSSGQAGTGRSPGKAEEDGCSWPLPETTDPFLARRLANSIACGRPPTDQAQCSLGSGERAYGQPCLELAWTVWRVPK